MITIWFPNFYTEAHRSEEYGLELVRLLKEQGIKCLKDPVGHYDAVLCGSVFYHKQLNNKTVGNRPLFHYNWDLYPWQIEANSVLYDWPGYIESLKTATEIWVPSRCTADRTREFTGREAVVIKTSIRLWEPNEPAQRGDYVIDVMRPYATPDPNQNDIENACKALSLPYKATKHALSWEEFKRTICGARLIASAYCEASTGGLTLLEGYWHGVPVLLSDSPYHGGVDYFEDRATYFKYNDFDDLCTRLTEVYYSNRHDIPEARAWITRNYSEEVFAKQIADRIKAHL